MPKDTNSNSSKRQPTLARRAVGKFIGRKIKERGLTISQLDGLCDFTSDGTSSRLVNGRQQITPEIATALPAHLGGHSEFWVSIEAKVLENKPNFMQRCAFSDKNNNQLSEILVFMEDEFNKSGSAGDHSRSDVMRWIDADGRVTEIPKDWDHELILELYRVWVNATVTSEPGPSKG